MNDTELPALPPVGESGPDVCNVVRLYLAVSRDLPPDQVQAVAAHVRTCKTCAWEHKLMSKATRVMATMDASAPSSHVDQAVMAAIAARTSKGGSARSASRPLYASTRRKRRGYTGPSLRMTGLVAAAVVLIAVLATLQFGIFSHSSSTQAFALPTKLSWQGNVLHSVQTKMSATGERYQVTTYDYLGANRMNVETTMDGGKLDVMAVKDGQDVLTMDMTNHVAQWGVKNWNTVDDSLFNLAQVRSDLQTKRAVFQGKDKFQGQDVYRIHYTDGSEMLLDMNYKPVNVLRASGNEGMGQALYDKLELLSPGQVPESTWDMTVPSGFQTGQITVAKP